MTKSLFILLFTFITSGLCAQDLAPSIYVLGIAQDGGYPHSGCTKKCCTKAWKKTKSGKYITSLALADPATKKWWLFEATPNIKEQLHYFQQLTGGGYNYLPEGIFITHAHIGHYTGLMELGREVMNTHEVPVYVLPKMKNFLESNGPWSQLVTLKNIRTVLLTADTPVVVNNRITITAFTVPHRDEFSETAGFRIETPNRKYLFIPDINKWNKWNRSIVTEVKKVDIALVDGTFYDSTELQGRNMSEVPHPFMLETTGLFKDESPATKSKVFFIHFNHTNPLLSDKRYRKKIKEPGFNLAMQGAVL